VVSKCTPKVFCLSALQMASGFSCGKSKEGSIMKLNRDITKHVCMFVFVIYSRSLLATEVMLN
jgi:hypothetical protein